MGWLSNGLKNLFKNKKIETNFDKYNIETSSILEIDSHPGIKTEVSKTISNNLQLSAISILNSDKFIRNLFCTFCTTNSLFQFSFDQNMNLQLQGTHLYKRICTKFNTVYSEDKNIFSQINVEMNNKLNNLCLKLIKPAIKGASYIYIFNYMQQLGNATIGAEIISSESYCSLSFAGRYKKGNSIGSVGLQHLNTLSVDFYRKISDFLEIGVSSSVSRDKTYSYGLGCKMNTARSEVKVNIDNSKKLKFGLVDKLSEEMSVNLNCEVGKRDFTYGYGLNYYF
ncbi:hypothetical protein NGRA_1902 [Nosema granulosis]|uniref:Uncharacterized protein n=1 Tax=Nosema granulosis TaxID=83296 RepID=A0A9P6H0X2_9MICR|nr:hypothetical protein NGRA_1902 [Nosema granulosis]